MKLEKARAVAEELKNGLGGECHRIEIVGDIRRQKPRVRKIKLLCIRAPLQHVFISQDDLLFAWLMTSRECLPEWDDPDAVHNWVMYLMEQGVLEWTSTGGQTYSAAKKSVVHQPSGMAVDIVSTNERCWAVALVVTTGGAKTNRRIAAAAQEKGWRFQSSDDGFDTPGGHITCKTEQEVFEAVGLSCLPPEQRE